MEEWIKHVFPGSDDVQKCKIKKKKTDNGQFRPFYPVRTFAFVSSCMNQKRSPTGLTPQYIDSWEDGG